MDDRQRRNSDAIATIAIPPCCCLPWRYACWMAAIYFILNNVAELAACNQEFNALQKNEYEDNKKHLLINFRMEIVIAFYILRATLAAAINLISMAVIFATIMKVVALLKIAACAVAVLAMTQTMVKVFMRDMEAGMQWLWDFGLIMVSLYFCLVWYKYAEYIERGWVDGVTGFFSTPMSVRITDMTTNTNTTQSPATVVTTVAAR